MDLSNGSRLGVIGSVILAVGLIAAVALSLWVVLYLFSAAVATLPHAANGTVNASAFNTTSLDQVEEATELSLVASLVIPGVVVAALEVIGTLMIGLAIVAFGRRYGDASMSRYGIYGAILMAVGFATAALSSSLPNLYTLILMVIGAIVLVPALSRLADKSGYKRLRYYGYALVLGSLLQFIDPVGLIILAIVALLLIFAFRSLGRLELEKSPFETNPEAVVAPQHRRRKAKGDGAAGKS